MKVGDRVKVGKCADPSNPILRCCRNRIGEIEEIADMGVLPILVKFNNGKSESFWPEELKKVR